MHDLEAIFLKAILRLKTIHDRRICVGKLWLGFKLDPATYTGAYFKMNKVLSSIRVEYNTHEPMGNAIWIDMKPPGPPQLVGMLLLLFLFLFKY